ncbi:MAG: glycosyltransferase family 39 protein [Tatlockia sp.]|nr:glycosyltransferase family 39 protein [Tatlockia sp.]
MTKSSFQNCSCILVLFIVGLALFLPRLGSLPFRGEEPRRVISSYEMLESKNWFVPTIQHQIFLSRPPMQNWIIALTGMARGSFDHLTGRLPSIVCALLTAFLIYYYCIGFLPRGSAFLASLFFLTMPQVLQLGRTAETELMFTLFLSGSFLLWHRGEMSNWPNFLKWGLAYILLAFATLTKGINQAPVFFAAIIGINIIYTHRLKSFFSLSQFFGLMLYFFIVGFWQWGFIYHVGAKIGWLMHAGDVSLRFENSGFLQYFEHALIFPFELLAVMLPWSIFLIIYAHRSLRSNLFNSSAKPVVMFCFSAIVITILSVWIPPGARTRYYMPIFPCFAILAAIAAETLLKSDLKISSRVGNSIFQMFSNAWPFLIPFAGLINFLLTILDLKFWQPSEPILNAIIYLLASFILGLGLFLNKHIAKVNKFYFSVVCYALFASLTINLVYTDSRKAKYNDVEEQLIIGLKNLPRDAKFVSLGPIAYEVLYYYLLNRGEILPVVSYESLLKSANPKTYLFQNFAYQAAIANQIVSEIEINRFKKEYSLEPVEKVLISRLMPSNR